MQCVAELELLPFASFATHVLLEQYAFAPHCASVLHVAGTQFFEPEGPTQWPL